MVDIHIVKYKLIRLRDLSDNLIDSSFFKYVTRNFRNVIIIIVDEVTFNTTVAIMMNDIRLFVFDFCDENKSFKTKIENIKFTRYSNNTPSREVDL